MLRSLLADAGREDLLDPAQLLVSEVVTNALVHSASPIDVSMAATSDGVLVEVGDGSEHVPQLRHYALTANTGRGLALLERTADAWGVVPGLRGKTVWFQLSAADGGDGPDDRADDGGDGWGDGWGATTETPAPPEQMASVVSIGERAAQRDTVRVELLNVPLLMHAAWQQYAEAVLREYLLASMDIDAEDDPFAEHAMATDALAVLAEHIPLPYVPGDSDAVMSAATGPSVIGDLVHLEVARDGVPHFAVLARMLDQAQNMARRGDLLVPVVQPEMFMLRTWLCDQVAAQAGGSSPQPWPPPQTLVPPQRRGLAWDAHTVDGSDLAMVAADDSDIVVAASDAALRLLGYDDRTGLVGRRLVSIIPQEFRQAHLAGFTLHQLTGRGPLFGAPVRVPVLRRDGEQVPVRLTLAAERLDDGGSVYVATLTDPNAPERPPSAS